MGLHRHVRVCVNGTKNHSTGTWNESIFNDLMKENNPLHYKGMPSGKEHLWFRDDKVFHMSFLFFKRHQNHKRRTLERVVAYEFAFGRPVRRLVWTPENTIWRDYNLEISTNQNLYDNLTKINFFSGEMLWDFVQYDENVVITNFKVDPATGNQVISVNTITSSNQPI